MCPDCLRWIFRTGSSRRFTSLRPAEVIRANTNRRSRLSRARNQAAFFQTVEDPGNVGISGNHAACDFPAREPLRSSSQDVTMLHRVA